MYIHTQNRQRMINVDFIISFKIEKNKINYYEVWSYNINNNHFILGSYKTKEQADTILKEIIMNKNTMVYYEMPDNVED